MILVISSPEDPHAQAVLAELDRLGRPARLVNLAEFPMRMSLSARFDNNGSNHFSLGFAGGDRVSLADVTAVWWRRPQPFGLPAELAEPAYRQFALSEASTAFHGAWQSTEALWINDPVRDAAAAHKPWQLKLAKEVGLTLPETLITNDPAAAREFWRRYPGEVIYKPFLQTAYAWRETRLLRRAEEALAEAVRLAPVIFQRYVPAGADLRIIAIGDRLFAAEAHGTDDYEIDVRFNTRVGYRPHTLPDGVAAKLRALQRRLGLEYGAIDMRRTPAGEYVFFEVNPAGQFLYIEQLTGQPIAAALAAHLSAGAAAAGAAAG
jgi:glutathione synthase/RimK-type ligase-like ATP-grasp enzyme